MSRTRMLSAVVLCSGLGIAVLGDSFAVRTAAQEKKGPNVQDPPKDARDTDQSKAVQNLELAARLIQFGRSQKHAESLLIAAQILHKTPTEKLKIGAKVTGDKSDVAAPAPKDNSPRALLAEAKKLSSSPAVTALAEATQKILDEETRSPVGGAKRGVFTVGPGQVLTLNPITFVGGQRAMVDVDLYGVSARMVLEVRDQFGNVVARDAIFGPFYNVQWYPAFTGTYTVRLTNIDTITLNCDFLIN